MGGRFLTPDWSKNPQGVPYANYDNPQSLNLYAYVGDNPLSLVDADGHDGCTDTTNGPCEKKDAAQKNSKAEQSKSQQQNNGTGGLNKDKFVDYMDQHAADKSTHRCGVACRKGLAAGGLDTTGHPRDAKDDGPFLMKLGASIVPNKDYKPEKGDVVVFGGNKSHPFGHVDVYDGKGWVSDFKQHNMIPYSSNVPPHTIYRFPDDQ